MPEKIVATGGVAKGDLWFQIKADLIGCDFVTTDCQEPATRGAAILVATVAGWADDVFTLLLVAGISRRKFLSTVIDLAHMFGLFNFLKIYCN